MRNWKAACNAAIFALVIASFAHADEFTKLTLLTFSAPVELPGTTLPAGTYRFELADPTTGRRVIRVSDKDGTKNYGIFLSMSDQRLEPADKPVVMFGEAPAGAPQAVKAWFYPGESYGYEFVYPHDQALKIAKAAHTSVLAMKDQSTASTTDEERVASMKGADVTRIDESDRPVSTDARLKESSSQKAAATTASTTATPTTASPTTTAPTSAASTTAAPRAATPSQPAPTTAEPTGVGTSGTAAARPARSSLPRTGSELPLLAFLSLIALSGGVAARLARKSV
jgi:hypothetical protein